ncbi:MAG: GIY-YIG nuclease family protein [Candidatus Omnitrophica bacterium]|nr:GIY-YIG nuclease family protein [Candidatus Omnitrophota bacterium]MBU1127747.1 GIY-YIG nuclease family protein [Candidatus Omnitrophota bacterium]MBU1783710.1 GIY-YIG nuclease family protein [Candidatus Omnitrophota bacterium]MBU1851770.1 GIY-YIG nuclease family protein [Candidatus Omnitrophota bacterium]
MSHVYLIQSKKFPEKIYVGFTKHLTNRLKAHNAGHSIYTMRYKPWELIIAVEFADIDKAKKFEKYLKTVSGKAFLKRHFL